jgi:hypothetical protein
LCRSEAAPVRRICICGAGDQLFRGKTKADLPAQQHQLIGVEEGVAAAGGMTVVKEVEARRTIYD